MLFRGSLGSTTNVHPAFTGRVVKLMPFGRPGKADDPDSHGTHVCGSVLGNGNSASMGGVIQGTAPKAKLMVQSLLDSTGGLGGIPNDLHDLFAPAYNDKARVHTNSWGSTIPGLPYSQSSREIDDFVWHHQDCVICFSAGNDGIDSNADGIVDEGQVGSELRRQELHHHRGKRKQSSGSEIDLRGDTAQFLPAQSAFRRPDGQQSKRHGGLQQPRSDQGATFEARRSRARHRDLSALSRAASDSGIFGLSSDPAYFFDAGTSMATPLVAGCCAVLRETLVKNGMPKPSAALIKALLINGAVPLPGQYTPPELGFSPNNISGWGRVDLAGSVIIPGPNPNAGLGEGGPLKQGQEETITIKIPPVTAATAW